MKSGAYENTPTSNETIAKTGPPRILLKGLFSQMLGVRYPKDYVVSAIAATEAPSAMKDLLAAGFGRDSVYLRDAASIHEIREQIYEQCTRCRRLGPRSPAPLMRHGEAHHFSLYFAPSRDWSKVADYASDWATKARR